MNQLSIANVVNISVLESPTGLGQYNTSNIGLFTDETPGDDFGDDGFKIYLDPAQVAEDFGSNSTTYAMALKIFSQAPNMLQGGGYLAVIPVLEDETPAAAITRTKSLVQYFGVMFARILNQVETLAAGTVIETLNKMGFFVSRTAAAVDVGGMLDLLRSGNMHKSRGLYYGSDNDDDALGMMAAYVGRALSTNFSGSNTTQTMHMKDLKTVQPDPSLDEATLAKCKTAGVDVYASFQGVPKVFSTGANRFFDDVYNECWLVGALEIGGFNVLAQVGNKIAQTENGVRILKNAFRQVCEQAVSNQYVAPGSWTSPSTFGVQEDLLSNIEQRGYYIYSQPVSQQLQADREARKAPVIQIAIKAAGAIHSSSVIVNVNL